MAFLNSILKNSSNHKIPFEHWELNQPLTDGQVQEIVKERRCLQVNYVTFETDWKVN